MDVVEIKQEPKRQKITNEQIKLPGKIMVSKQTKLALSSLKYKLDRERKKVEIL